MIIFLFTVDINIIIFSISAKLRIYSNRCVSFAAKHLIQKTSKIFVLKLACTRNYSKTSMIHHLNMNLFFVRFQTKLSRFLFNILNILYSLYIVFIFILLILIIYIINII